MDTYLIVSSEHANSTHLGCMLVEISELVTVYLRPAEDNF
jgi:hypothetical protein